MMSISRCAPSLSYISQTSTRSLSTVLSAPATLGSSEEPQETEAKPLYATVASHRSYIFLHASTSPATFPARFSTPIQRALMLKVLKWGGIVNFSWNGGESSGPTSATAFSIAGGRLDIPEITLENLDEAENKIKRHALEGPLVKDTRKKIHLYVCTHGARDCRCGDTGGALAMALRAEVERRVKRDPMGPASRVKVGEVGHVGGHQYAANLLVFPHGEWLGMLKPENAPEVLSAILERRPEPFNMDQPPICPDHWRGRMGLSKDEQLEVYMTSQSKIGVINQIS